MMYAYKIYLQWVIIIGRLTYVTNQNTVNGSYAQLPQFYASGQIMLCNSQINQTHPCININFTNQSNGGFQASYDVIYYSPFAQIPAVQAFIQNYQNWVDDSSFQQMKLSVDVSTITTNKFTLTITLSNITTLNQLYFSYMASYNQRIIIQKQENLNPGYNSLNFNILNQAIVIQIKILKSQANSNTLPQVFCYLMGFNASGLISVKLKNSTMNSFGIQFVSDKSNSQIDIAIILLDMSDNTISLFQNQSRFNLLTYDPVGQQQNPQNWHPWNSSSNLQILMTGFNEITLEARAQFGCWQNVTQNLPTLWVSAQSFIQTIPIISLSIQVMFLSQIQCGQNQGSPFQGTCICGNAQYVNQSMNICSSCEPTCAQCNGQGANNCTQCQDMYFLNSSNSCQNCLYSCLTCSTGNQCLTCDSSKNRQIHGSTCNCTYGYYETNNNVCQICSYSCLTCSQSNQCLTCDSSKNRKINESTCNCSDGYFETNNNVCQICSYSCLTCFSDIQCISCNLTLNRKLNGLTCNCQDGYYEITPALTCQICSYSCLTCFSDIQCISCNLTLNRKLNGLTCNCQDGYYEITPALTCYKCLYSCKTCQTNNTCVTCDLQQFRQGPNCICQAKYYETESLVCQKCLYSCLTCIAADKCTSCDTSLNRAIDAQYTCNCQNGYYEKTTYICQKCLHTCLTCNTSYICLTCDLLLNRNLNASTCNCENGYYESQFFVCQKCLYSCSTCSKRDQCSTCNHHLNRGLRLSVCNCLDGYYETTTFVCQKCHQSCLSCTTNNECVSCDSTQNRQLDSQNLCSCYLNFYDKMDNAQCQPCTQKCIKKNGSNYTCNSDCVNIQDQYGPLTANLKNKYWGVRNSSTALTILVEGLVPFGFFGYLLKSPQFIISQALLGYDQPELIYQFQRLLSVSVLPPYLSDDPIMVNQTTLQQFFVWNVTDLSYKLLTHQKFHTLGLSPLLIFSIFSQYVYLAIFSSIYVLGGFYLIIWGFSVKNLAKNLILRTIKGGFLYIIASQIVSLWAMSEQSMRQSIEFIISFVLSIIFLMIYMVFHISMIQDLKKYQVQRKLINNIIIERQFDQIKRMECPLYLTFVNFKTFQASIYSILTQFKKLLLLINLIFFNLYASVQLCVSITLTIYHIFYMIRYHPHRYKIIFYLDLTQQASFLMLLLCSLYDYSQSFIVDSNSRSGIVFVYIACLAITIDAMKYIVKWIFLFINFYKKKQADKVLLTKKTFVDQPHNQETYSPFEIQSPK